MEHELDTEYNIGTEAPDGALWALWYQGYVRYYATYADAELAERRLSEHECENSEITEVED